MNILSEAITELADFEYAGNLVIAGDCVLEVLLGTTETVEIDIFIVGSHAKICGALISYLADKGYYLDKKANNCIGINSPSSNQEFQLDFQVDFNEYETVQEVMDSFDWTVCQIGLSADNGKVYTTNDFLSDFSGRVLTPTTTWKRPLLQYRIKKFEDKGFVPEFDFQEIYAYGVRNHPPGTYYGILQSVIKGSL